MRGWTRWGAFLATVVALLWVVAAAQAASHTLVVTTTADSAAGDTGACLAGGSCTLRQAITQANADSSGDTVSVPAGTYVLVFGPLMPAATMTVNGAGAASTLISGGDASEILDTPGPGQVTFSGVTLEHGKTTSRGGAVLIAPNGTLTLSDSVVTGSTAVAGGGGIEVHGSLYLDASSVAGNSATGATASGGGIEVAPPAGQTLPSANISQSTVSGNSAANGGGIEVAGTTSAAAQFTLDHSTVSGNRAVVDGGGIDGTKGGSGGTLFVFTSTIADNSAAAGGGLAVGAFDTWLNQSTIAGNVATGAGGDIDATGSSIPAVSGSIVADGSAATGSDCAGQATSGGGNLDDASGCGFTTSTDVHADPRLGALGDNGGPTHTMALLPGSPAINALGQFDCSGARGTAVTDQRGVPRPQNGACDIGAYEVAGPDSNRPSAVATATTATITVGVANPDPEPGTVRIDYGVGAYDLSTSAASMPAASSTAPYVFTLTSLDPGRTYEYEVVASNPDGTSVDAFHTFATTWTPTVVTEPASGVSADSATLNATVDPVGASAVAQFRWGTSPELVGSRTTDPIAIPPHGGPVSIPVTGLVPGTTYYARIEALDSDTGAAATGAIVSFTTPALPVPKVSGSLRWTFRRGKHGIRVKRLLYAGGAPGATVTIDCRGRGCPFTSRSHTIEAPHCGQDGCPPGVLNVDLARLFRHHHLHPGTRLTITITEPGRIGRDYVLRLGRHRTIRTRGCLAPGSTTSPMTC